MGLGQTWSGTTHRRHCLHHPLWNILEVIDIELTYIYNYILSYSQNWNGPPIGQGSRLNSPCHRPQGNTERSPGRSHSKLFRFSRKAAVLQSREISTHAQPKSIRSWGLNKKPTRLCLKMGYTHQIIISRNYNDYHHQIWSLSPKKHVQTNQFSGKSQTNISSVYILYHIVSYCIILYYIVLYYILLYYIILNHIVSYCIILYYIILYCII